MTAEHMARVPAENLRVSRAEFGRVWAQAERRGDLPAGGPDDEYAVGVVFTCEWLARQSVWNAAVRRWEMPRTPLSRRREAAMPETIDAEYLAAAVAPAFARDRARGVMATLEWAWHGSGRPPLSMPAVPAAG